MQPIAVVLGVGAIDGVGGALCRRFASEGQHVVAAGRTREKLDAVVELIRAAGGQATACVIDVTREEDIEALFEEIDALEGDLSAVLYNAGNNAPMPFEECTAALFEEMWRVSALGAFHTAKAALPRLAELGAGSLMFTGASASLRGRPMFGHFAAAKAAERNLAQALAREYGPRGVHVAHVIVDGVIDGDFVRSRFGTYLDQLGDEGALAPTAIAEAFWMLHVQDRTAWTHELDLRPFKESW